MLFYFFVVVIAMLLVEISTVVCALTLHNMTLLYAILAPIFVNFYALAILGLAAWLMRILLPKKLWNHKRRLFAVNEKEIKFYNNIKIKNWKDKIPEFGCITGLSKKEIASVESKYLARFLQETCYSETMHAVAGVLPFTVLFVMPVQDYFFTLPILFVNLFLHVLPCIVQRYNRFRLGKVYDKILSKEAVLQWHLQFFNKKIT